MPSHALLSSEEREKFLIATEPYSHVKRGRLLKAQV